LLIIFEHFFLGIYFGHLLQNRFSILPMHSATYTFTAQLAIASVLISVLIKYGLPLIIAIFFSGFSLSLDAMNWLALGLVSLPVVGYGVFLWVRRF